MREATRQKKTFARGEAVKKKKETRTTRAYYRCEDRSPVSATKYLKAWSEWFVPKTGRQS